MSIDLKHSGLWHAARRTNLFLILLLVLYVGPTLAEETETTLADPDSDQSDIYYDAMIRSIELDTNRWKSFSRSMESGPWFYDTQSLKRDSGKVTALVTVYPHPNRTETLQFRLSRAHQDQEDRVRHGDRLLQTHLPAATDQRTWLL